MPASSQVASLAACLFPCCFPRKPSSSSRSAGNNNNDLPNEQTPLLRDGSSSSLSNAASGGAAGIRGGQKPGSKKIGSLQSAEKTEKEASPFMPPPPSGVTRVDDRDKLSRIVSTLQGTFLPVGPAHSHRHLLSSTSPHMARKASTSTGGSSSNSASESVVLSGLAGKDDRRSSKLVRLWGKEEEEEQAGEGATLDQAGDDDTGKRKLSIDTKNDKNKNLNQKPTAERSTTASTTSAASDTTNISTPTGGPSPALTPTRTPLTLNTSSSSTTTSTTTGGLHSSSTPVSGAAAGMPTSGAGPISPSGSAVALQSLSMTAAAVPPPSAPSVTLDGQSTDAQKSLRKSSTSGVSGRRRDSSAGEPAQAPISPAGKSRKQASSAATKGQDVSAPAPAAPPPKETDWQKRLEERLRAVTLEQGPLMESWEEADLSTASVATPPFTGVVPAADGPMAPAEAGKMSVMEDI